MGYFSKVVQFQERRLGTLRKFFFVSVPNGLEPHAITIPLHPSLYTPSLFSIYRERGYSRRGLQGDVNSNEPAVLTHLLSSVVQHNNK